MCPLTWSREKIYRRCSFVAVCSTCYTKSVKLRLKDVVNCIHWTNDCCNYRIVDSWYLHRRHEIISWEQNLDGRHLAAIGVGHWPHHQFLKFLPCFIKHRIHICVLTFIAAGFSTRQCSNCVHPVIHINPLLNTKGPLITNSSVRRGYSSNDTGSWNLSYCGPNQQIERG